MVEGEVLEVVRGDSHDKVNDCVKDELIESFGEGIGR